MRRSCQACCLCKRTFLPPLVSDLRLSVLLGRHACHTCVDPATDEGIVPGCVACLLDGLLQFLCAALNPGLQSGDFCVVCAACHLCSLQVRHALINRPFFSRLVLAYSSIRFCSKWYPLYGRAIASHVPTPNYSCSIWPDTCSASCSHFHQLQTCKAPSAATVPRQQHQRQQQHCSSRFSNKMHCLLPGKPAPIEMVTLVKPACLLTSCNE